MSISRLEVVAIISKLVKKLIFWLVWYHALLKRRLDTWNRVLGLYIL